MECLSCGGDNPAGAERCKACGVPLAASDLGASDALPAGVVLDGRYRLDRVLGEGGFGKTYKGFDERMRRPVAVKEFFPEGCSRQGVTVRPARSLSARWRASVETFKSESATLIPLESLALPRLLRVHDV